MSRVGRGRGEGNSKERFLISHRPPMHASLKLSNRSGLEPMVGIPGLVNVKMRKLQNIID